MKHYVVAELQVTDPAWVGPYVESVTELVERHGGRYLARTPKAERLEGDRPLPQVFLVIEWPSREAALAFYDSEDYRPFREQRVDGSVTEMALVAGEDVAGLAEGLPSGGEA